MRAEFCSVSYGEISAISKLIRARQEANGQERGLLDWNSHPSSRRSSTRQLCQGHDHRRMVLRATLLKVMLGRMELLPGTLSKD